jgi:hypothetical protein
MVRFGSKVIHRETGREKERERERKKKSETKCGKEAESNQAA